MCSVSLISKRRVAAYLVAAVARSGKGGVSAPVVEAVVKRRDWMSAVSELVACLSVRRVCREVVRGEIVQRS